MALEPDLGIPQTGHKAKDFENPNWKLTESGATYRKGKFRSLNGDVYNGEWLNGKKHGKGQTKYANGDKYLGQWREGRYDGFGVFTKATFTHNGVDVIGRRYEGEFKSGAKHGNGTYNLGTGDIYEGQFAFDRYHGEGTLKYANGDRYTGQWKNGLWHGQGKLRKACGDIYVGSFNSGYKHGVGEFAFHDDGGTYHGEWRRGFFHGEGVREFLNGTIYEGQFHLGHMHGHGKLTFPNGDYYLGSFERDQYSGIGTLLRADGTRYVGTFLRGQPCGRGRHEYNDGGYYDGEFLAMVRSDKAGVKEYLAADGKRHGRGVRVWVSGNRFEGQWVKDAMHGYGVFEGAVGGVGQRYEGMFEKGHRCGRGVCHYGNSRKQPFVCFLGHRHDGRSVCTYDGTWEFDLPSGHGKYSCADGRLYDGEWRDGKRHGQGRMVLLPDMHRGDPDRCYIHGVDALYRIEWYEGTWNMGVREGEGTIGYENGVRVRGIFREGNVHGKAEITWASGRARHAWYEFGNRVRWISAEDDDPVVVNETTA